MAFPLRPHASGRMIAPSQSHHYGHRPEGRRINRMGAARLLPPSTPPVTEAYRHRPHVASTLDASAASAPPCPTAWVRARGGGRPHIIRRSARGPQLCNLSETYTSLFTTARRAARVRPSYARAAPRPACHGTMMTWRRPEVGVGLGGRGRYQFCQASRLVRPCLGGGT